MQQYCNDFFETLRGLPSILMRLRLFLSGDFLHSLLTLLLLSLYYKNSEAISTSNSRNVTVNTLYLSCEIPPTLEAEYIGQKDKFPICFETKKPLLFKFRQQRTISCGLEIKSDSFYTYLLDKAKSNREAFSCTLRRYGDNNIDAEGKDLKIPISIPIWASVDARGNLHVNNRLDFVLVVGSDDKTIVGAGVVSVKSSFQSVKPGNILNLHGLVRWVRQQDGDEVIHVPLDERAPQILDPMHILDDSGQQPPNLDKKSGKNVMLGDGDRDPNSEYYLLPRVAGRDCFGCWHVVDS